MLHHIHCSRCGRTIEIRMGGKTMCQICEFELNGKLHGIAEPLPQPVKHTEKKPLKHIGSPCPYCRGTTGFHPIEKLVICYSCDASWSLQGVFLGKIENVGVIR